MRIDSDREPRAAGVGIVARFVTKVVEFAVVVSPQMTAGRRAVLQRSTAIVKWNARSFPHLESFTGNLVYSKLGDIHGPTQVHGHLYYVSDLICTPAGDNVTSPNSGVNGPVAG
jgi:hypothetical protein